MTRGTLLALALLILPSTPASSQSINSPELRVTAELQKPNFGLMSVDDGLPENSGVAITQDSQGFLWIGTINGLVRYDGFDYKIFQPVEGDSTSLADPIILDIYEDRDGDLIVGTTDGLSILNRDLDTFTSLVYDPNQPDGLAGEAIEKTFEDSRGNYWIGSRMNDERRGGLQLFDKNTLKFTRTFLADSTIEGSLSNDAVTDIVEDEDGILWIATYGGGLNRYDWRTDAFTSYRNVPADPTSLSNDLTLKVYIDRLGIIWVGAGEAFGQDVGGALNRFDPETGKFKRYLETVADLDEQRSSSVNVITEDNNGTLWVGSIFGGLSRYDREQDLFTTYSHDSTDPESIAGQSILSVYADRSGVLWIGSWSDGINNLTSASSRFPFFGHDPRNSNSLAPGDVMSIIEDRDRVLWIGTDTGGLTRFDRVNNEFTRFMPGDNRGNSISHSFVRILYQDSQGIVWIGTFGNGLDRFDPSTNRFTNFPPDKDNPLSISHGSVRSILEDSQGLLWVGTWGGGLNVMDRANGTFRNYKHDPAVPTSIPDDQISKVTEDSKGRLLVTFNNVDGLYVFDRKSEAFDLAQAEASIGGMTSEDSKGRIWGTGFRGLTRFDDELNISKTYTAADGLSATVVSNVLESRDANLWLSTERGITRFDPESESIRNYTSSSGLRLRSYTPLAAFASPSGELFFGGRGGFHAFYPDRIVSNSTPPPVVITELRLDNQVVDAGSEVLKKDISQTKSLKLSYDQNDLGFTFAALHFENPKQNHYRYKLDGYDDDWIEASTSRTATYTNLSPGRYTLRAIAANSDGIWNEEGTSLSLHITPPWWKTFWAYGSYLFVLVGTIFAFDRYQRRRLVSRERERSRIEQVELRAIAAESQTKLLQIENERKRNIELLSEIGRKITSSLSIDQIIETVYESVNDLMDASVFGIGVYNPGGGTIDFPASKEKGLSLEPFNHQLDDPNRLSVRCLMKREAIIIRDYAAEYLKYVEVDLPPVKGESPRSVVYLPLVHQGKPIGVLTAQSFAADAYSDYHVNILKSLASYTAIAIDNADAYRQLSSTVEVLKSTQAQLVHQEKLASLGELTAGIAHEIKNPLNFVNNFAEVGLELYGELREALGRGEDVHELLEDIEQGTRQIAEHGKRADSIVRAMMMHAAGGTGDFQPTDANALVGEFVELAYNGKRARSPDFVASIESSYDSNLGLIEIIPQDIGRVLLNLVGNAFDAVRDRAASGENNYSPTVSVSTSRSTEWAEICVSDNGTGVESSIRDKIFEPFFTTKSPGSGTGLGLSMSYDIVTKTHRGEMTMESEVGKGTTFRVRLPIAQQVLA